MRRAGRSGDNQVAGGVAAGRSATEFGASIIILRSERALNLLSEDFPLRMRYCLSRFVLSADLTRDLYDLCERSSSLEIADFRERSVFTTQRQRT
jgi:hypothetical protein